MADLMVTSLSVGELLTKLRAREWLIPQFQREFVWTIQDVIDFVYSILNARPVGMATLWEQADESQLALEPMSLPDINEIGNGTVIQFCDATENPKKIYAILDGKQRCTAIAMVFGGFHSNHKSFKVSGRFFLNVAEKDPAKQVVFIKEHEIGRKGYDKEASCISNGLFPLSTGVKKEGILEQWMRYIQEIRNPANYPDSHLPDEEELERRNSVLKRSFDGIIRTKLAVYIVPETYDLADVCEIFETLNISGVKVSTVDLVHSWLYADTANDTKQILLRDWISEFGQKDGANGWASNDRPDLMVQMSTACYVALEEKPKPRPFKGGVAKKAEEISSVKADDLLRTPTQHWKNIINNDAVLAEFLGDFQRLVGGGYFPWTSCPYPISALIYVALRFHKYADSPDKHPWGIEELNAIFRAFFWRNALTNRYDQGFLTQIGTDIKEMKKWLNRRPKYKSANQWAKEVSPHLDNLIDKRLPDLDQLKDDLTDALPAGALGKALILPMVATAKKDLVNRELSLEFPMSQNLQMHHIYPKNWCQDNKVGELAVLLDKEKANRDWVNSVVNLMPLSRESNNVWKTKQPGQVLGERGITYEESRKILQSAFIDKECFDYLKIGDKLIKEFWTHRAELIAQDLLERMKFVI